MDLLRHLVCYQNFTLWAIMGGKEIAANLKSQGIEDTVATVNLPQKNKIFCAGRNAKHVVTLTWKLLQGKSEMATFDPVQPMTNSFRCEA